MIRSGIKAVTGASRRAASASGGPSSSVVLAHKNALLPPRFLGTRGSWQSRPSLPAGTSFVGARSLSSTASLLGDEGGGGGGSSSSKRKVLRGPGSHSRRNRGNSYPDRNPPPPPQGSKESNNKKRRGPLSRVRKPSPRKRDIQYNEKKQKIVNENVKVKRRAPAGFCKEKWATFTENERAEYLYKARVQKKEESRLDRGNPKDPSQASTMELTFLGTSRASPTRYRNVSSTFLRLENNGMLFDCGEGTQHQLKRSNLRWNRIRTIFLTHAHGDHCFGLPGVIFTLCDVIPSDETLQIYGPPGTRAFLRTLLKFSQGDLTFRYEVTELHPPRPIAPGDTPNSTPMPEYFGTHLRGTLLPSSHGAPRSKGRSLASGLPKWRGRKHSSGSTGTPSPIPKEEDDRTSEEEFAAPLSTPLGGKRKAGAENVVSYASRTLPLASYVSPRRKKVKPRLSKESMTKFSNSRTSRGQPSPSPEDLAGLARLGVDPEEILESQEETYSVSPETDGYSPGYEPPAETAGGCYNCDYAHWREIPGRNLYPDPFGTWHIAGPVNNPRSNIVTGGFKVEARTVDHRVMSLAYAVVEDEKPGKLDAAKLLGLGVKPGPAFGHIKRHGFVHSESGECINVEDVTSPGLPGRRVVVMGDTCNGKNALKIAKGADLLVHESTHQSDMWKTSHSYGHSTPEDAALFARAASVKNLAITHFSSRYSSRCDLGSEPSVFKLGDRNRPHPNLDAPISDKVMKESVISNRVEETSRAFLRYILSNSPTLTRKSSLPLLNDIVQTLETAVTHSCLLPLPILGSPPLTTDKAPRKPARGVTLSNVKYFVHAGIRPDTIFSPERLAAHTSEREKLPESLVNSKEASLLTWKQQRKLWKEEAKESRSPTVKVLPACAAETNLKDVAAADALSLEDWNGWLNAQRGLIFSNLVEKKGLKSGEVVDMVTGDDAATLGNIKGMHNRSRSPHSSRDTRSRDKAIVEKKKAPKKDTYVEDLLMEAITVFDKKPAHVVAGHDFLTLQVPRPSPTS